MKNADKMQHMQNECKNRCNDKNVIVESDAFLSPERLTGETESRFFVSVCGGGALARTDQIEILWGLQVNFQLQFQTWENPKAP